MKNLFKKTFILIAILITLFASTLPASVRAIKYEAVYDDDTTYNPQQNNNNNNNNDSSSAPKANRELGSCEYLLPDNSMPSWDCGINPNPQNDQELQSNVVIIAKNVLESITAMAGYLAIGFIIYGGYLYIFSSGEPAKTASGKKTLTRAFIGLAIIGLAKIIISSVGVAFMNQAGVFSEEATKNCVNNACITPASLLGNAIGWFIGIAGVISVIFIVVGGISYMTAAGDPSKLQKAKATIYYALIGLTIVGLSFAINNFVIGAVNASNKGDDISQPLITLVNTVIGIAGLVAVAYVIKGAVGYMTSTGDPVKLKKAKDTILYACIGLIICALAFAIANWAISAINNSTPTDDTSSIELPKNAIAFFKKSL